MQSCIHMALNSACCVTQFLVCLSSCLKQADVFLTCRGIVVILLQAAVLPVLHVLPVFCPVLMKVGVVGIKLDLKWISIGRTLEILYEL